jgi:hypothetical protein
VNLINIMTCDHQLEIVVFPDHEMTSTNYHAVRTVPKSNRKIVERGKIITYSYGNMILLHNCTCQYGVKPDFTDIDIF